MVKEETVPDMELSGFPKEVFTLLRKDTKELSGLVKRFQEKKCSISCKILFEEQGNGIHQESGTQIIFLDYFWEENLLQIHR